jgi:hypothetical protein
MIPAVQPRQKSHRKHRLQHFLYCCVRIHYCEYLLIKPLPSNARLFASTILLVVISQYVLSRKKIKQNLYVEYSRIKSSEYLYET